MKLLTVILMLVLLIGTVQYAAADDLFEIVKQQTLYSLRTHAAPLVRVFGQAIGGGLYHTASTHGALGFDLGVQAMAVIIPHGESQLLDDADVSLVPLPVLVGNLGLPMGFGVMARGVGYKYQGQTASLIGLGLKNDFGSLIPVPGFPHAGVIAAYHSFKGGDYITATVVSFDVMASKSFIFIEPYAGFGFDRTTMKFKYMYTDMGGSVPIDEKFSESTSRFTVGAKLSPFPFVKVYGDYNFSKFKSFTVGLAVSFR